MTITNIRPGERIKVHSRGVTAVELAAVVIVSANITDGAVTNAKIADDAINAAKIVANAIGASEISGGAVGTSELADLGVTTAKLADGAVTTIKLLDDSVTAAKIAASAVGASEISGGAVGTSELADDGVTTAKLADDAVTAAKIAASAVGSTELSTGAVTATKYADGSITAAKYADNSIDTAKITGDAITAAKIADNAIGTEHLSNSAVTAAEIADGAITALKYADVSITAGKYADNSIDTAKITAAAVTSAKLGTSLVLTGNPTVPLALTSNESGSIASTLHVANKIDDVLGSGGVSILSPNLGGVPVTATPTTNNDSAQIPNTSWVQDELSAGLGLKANITSPVFLGNPTVPLALTSNESGSIASTLHVANKIDDVLQSGGVVIDSPNFDGIPVAPTPTTDDDSAQVPNTAWVQAEILPKANLASPTFTGNPVVPTAGLGTESGTAASTLYVRNKIDDILEGPGVVITSPNLNGTPVTATPAIDNDSAQIPNTSWVRDRIQVQVGDGLEALYDIVEQGDTPGNAPNAFSVDASLLGARSTKTPLPSSYIVTDDRGAVARFSGAFMVQKSDVFHVRSGRLYEITAVVQTRTNTPDTSGDAVHLKVRWLSRTKGATVGTDTDLDFDANPITGSGRVTLYGIVSTGSGSGIDAVIPAGAVFGRPYVQGFGSGAVRDVEFIQVRDVSITGTGDLSALQSQVASLISINTGPRLEDLESITDAPEIETYKALGDAEAAATAGTIKTTTDIVRVLYDTTPGDFGQDARRYLRTVAAPGTYDDSFLDDDGTHWTRLIDTHEEVCRYAAGTNITADFTDRLKKAAANGRSLRLSPPVLGGSYESDMADLTAIAALYRIRLFMDGVTIKPQANQWLTNGTVGYAGSFAVANDGIVAGSNVVTLSVAPTGVVVGDWVGVLQPVDPTGNGYAKQWARVIATGALTVTVDKPYDWTPPSVGNLLKKFVFRPDFELRGDLTLDCTDITADAGITSFQPIVMNGNARATVDGVSFENWTKSTTSFGMIKAAFARDVFIEKVRARNCAFPAGISTVVDSGRVTYRDCDISGCNAFGLASSQCDRAVYLHNEVSGRYDKGAGSVWSVRGLKPVRCFDVVMEGNRVSNYDTAIKPEDSGRIHASNNKVFDCNSGWNGSHYELTYGITSRHTLVNNQFERIQTVAINQDGDDIQIFGGHIRDCEQEAISVTTKAIIEGVHIHNFDTAVPGTYPAISLTGTNSFIDKIIATDDNPTGKFVINLGSSAGIVGAIEATSGLAIYKASSAQSQRVISQGQVGGVFRSADKSIVVGQVGVGQDTVLAFGKSFGITFLRSTGMVMITDQGGQAIHVSYNFGVANVTIVGGTPPSVFVIGAPGVSQFGITHTVSTKVVTIASGFTSGSRTITVNVWGEINTISNPV